jgi:cytochrome c2
MIRMRTAAAVVTLVTAAVVTARQEKQVERTSDGQKPFQRCSGCHSAETSERKLRPSLKGLLDGGPTNECSIRL